MQVAGRGGLFVPCVAPGYDDERVRPWNSQNTRDREAGAYYDRAWRGAIDAGARAVGVTSFNEWHEGTQIEAAVPAAPARDGVPPYRDYGPDADFYLKKTASWVEAFARSRGNS